MSDCDRLREDLLLAKGARNASMTDNAQRENAGEAPLFSADELRTFRLRVHEAAAAARAGGCDISDLVGDNVGVGPFEG